MKKLIQIGACVGFDYAWDNFIKHGDCECVLIEPNPKAMAILKENYKNVSNIHYETVAISNQRCERVLFIDNYDKDAHGTGIGASLHASFSIKHHYIHNHTDEEITPLEVQCVTFDDIVVKYGWQNEHIDLLQTDTEGHDCDILLATDFSKYSIETIRYETLHSDGTSNKGKKFVDTMVHLYSHGYVFFKMELWDMIASKKPLS